MVELLFTYQANFYCAPGAPPVSAFCFSLYKSDASSCVPQPLWASVNLSESHCQWFTSSEKQSLFLSYECGENAYQQLSLRILFSLHLESYVCVLIRSWNSRYWLGLFFLRAVREQSRSSHLILACRWLSSCSNGILLYLCLCLNFLL